MRAPKPYWIKGYRIHAYRYKTKSKGRKKPSKWYWAGRVKRPGSYDLLEIDYKGFNNWYDALYAAWYDGIDQYKIERQRQLELEREMRRWNLPQCPIDEFGDLPDGAWHAMRMEGFL